MTLRMRNEGMIAALTGNALQHLRVGREFLHEHQQPLNRFIRFMTGEAAADQIDFFQLPRLQQQLFAPGAGQENIDRRINALIADFAVQHHFHVAGAFEFLEDQLVHAAAGFDQRGGDDGERASFFGVARGRENFARNFHGAGVDTAAHGASATAHRIVESAGRARDGIEQNENVLARFDQTLCALDRQLRDASVALDVAVIGAGDDLRLSDASV